MIHVLNIW